MGEKMEELHKILNSIINQAVQQCSLLIDSASNQDTHPANIKAMALEFILRELESQAEKLKKDENINRGLLNNIELFLEVYEKLKNVSIDVNLNLKELTIGWKCRICGTALAKIASISRVREGNPQVSLKCSACSSFTELSPEGMEKFKKIFEVNLKEPSWNPRINNFQWNGT